MLEMIFNGVLAVVLVAFFVLGSQIPEMSNPADFVEAKGFPMMFAIIALVLLAWEVLVQLKAMKKGAAEEDSKAFDLSNAPKVAIIIALTIVYILTVKYAGFIILTLVFTFISLNLLGSKKQIFNAIFSVAAVALLVVIFGRFFGVSLPRGAGFLREISFYLY